MVNPRRCPHEHTRVHDDTGVECLDCSTITYVHDEDGEVTWPSQSLTDAHRELLELITSAHAERNKILLLRVCHHQVHLLSEDDVLTVLRMVKVV